MPRLIVGLLVVCLLGIATSGAIAQGAGADDNQKLIDLLKADANAQRERAGTLEAEAARLRKRLGEVESPVYAKYMDTLKREYDFQSEMMDVNVHNFLHQRIAAYVILGLVAVVVLTALWFAHVQLMAGLRPVSTTPGKPGEEAAAQPAAVGGTTFEASLEKLTVSSSIVGVIVLVISLAFLYIYTREIYRIEMVDPYKARIATPDRGAGIKAPKKDGD